MRNKSILGMFPCLSRYLQLSRLITLWRIQDFQRRGRQPQRGAPTYYLTIFSRKLHEKEKKFWSRGRGARPSRPLRSATVTNHQEFFVYLLHQVNLSQSTSTCRRTKHLHKIRGRKRTPMQRELGSTHACRKREVMS